METIMKHIFAASVILTLCSLNGMDNNELIEQNNNPLVDNNNYQKPTLTACMNYYCCNCSEKFNATTTPEKVLKAGQCLLCTSLTTKSVEFCMASCCWPNMSVDRACQILWFPSCNQRDCSRLSYCCGASIDWPCTLMAFTSPLILLAGCLWKKHKEKNENPLHCDLRTL